LGFLAAHTLRMAAAAGRRGAGEAGERADVTYHSAGIKPDLANVGARDHWRIETPRAASRAQLAQKQISVSSPSLPDGGVGGGERGVARRARRSRSRARGCARSYVPARGAVAAREGEQRSRRHRRRGIMSAATDSSPNKRLPPPPSHRIPFSSGTLGYNGRVIIIPVPSGGYLR